MQSEQMPENQKTHLTFGFLCLSIIIIGLALIFLGIFGYDFYSQWYIGILIPLGVIIITLIILITLTALRMRKERKEDENYIPNEPFFASFKRLFRKKSDDELLEAEYSSIPVSERSYGRFGPGSDNQSNLEHQLNVTTRETSSGISIDSYLYEGKTGKEKCGICKLEFTSDDRIIQCPKCKTLFHFEHIEYWLQKNEKCPVCSYLFIKN
ncbi:MAG: hypothetical protein FK730_02710 [Asgard group archaeon]|nr:hypothetical protein [Asgard group archaeon]